MSDNRFRHDPEYDRRPTFELLEHIDDPHAVVRARALAALARRSHESAEIVQVLLDALRDQQTQHFLLPGLSTTMVVISSLWECGPDSVKPALVEIIGAMDGRERRRILAFLANQGIAIEGLEALV